MKTLLPFLAVLTVLAFASAPSLLRAQDAPPPGYQGDQGDQDDEGASFQTFYDQLGDQGNWIQTDDYGYVFQPNVSDPNWAPYTDGHWVYTDAGWMWVSDEPWGWATYHYGRWANIDGCGWVWVPGHRWAPAWVSWRYGGGYCGWAPLPPETLVGVGIGFHFGGDVDVSFNIGPGCYNFVRVGDMGERNYRGRYLDRSRNFTVINNTTNITNINTATGRSGARFQGVVVQGPPLNEVNAHSHQHIASVQLTAANQPGQSRLQGNSLAVYAPRGNASSTQAGRPARVSQTLGHSTFNRGDSITQPLAVTASVRPSTPSAAAIQAARTAQLHAPAKAKIATENTTVKPLTSLAPVTPTHRTTTTVVNPNTENSTANAPLTGEPVHKRSVTQPNEVKPQPQVQQQQQAQEQQQAQQESRHQQQVQAQQQQQAQEQQAQQESRHQQQVQAQQQQQVQQQQAQQESRHQQQAQAQQQQQVQQQQAQQESRHQQQAQAQQQQQSRQPQPTYKQGNSTNNAPGH